jgi:hypothetical protein
VARDLLKDGQEVRFFRGNLHCHSDRSDGLLGMTKEPVLEPSPSGVPRPRRRHHEGNRQIRELRANRCNQMQRLRGRVGSPEPPPAAAALVDVAPCAEKRNIVAMVGPTVPRLHQMVTVCS